MAELVDAQPGLDPDRIFDGLPSDLWGALVLQVIGQQLSLAAASAILTRLNDLHDGRMPTPAEPPTRRRCTVPGCREPRRCSFRIPPLYPPEPHIIGTACKPMA
jgi:3-methyladenine DNA glycosylase/8-oxoguanine DNA glycosylase